MIQKSNRGNLHLIYSLQQPIDLRYAFPIICQMYTSLFLEYHVDGAIQLGPESYSFAQDEPVLHKVLVFEDAPSGVLAAKNAGM